MKHFNKFLLTLLLSGAWTAGASAESYTCDFNTPITTSKHDFKVASNWNHIAPSFEKSGETAWVSYNYNSTGGIDGTGALTCSSQTVSIEVYYTDYEQELFDFLITPKVKGDVTIQAKRSSTYVQSFIEVYAYDDAKKDVVRKEDGTPADPITVFKSSEHSDWTNSDFQTIDLATGLDDYQRLALRLNCVTVDNFNATDAEIELEKAIEIVSVTPKVADPSSGTWYWDQAEDLSVPVKFAVKVKNTGEAPLSQSDEGYSIYIKNDRTSAISESVPVPFNLEVGETSEEFEISFTIPKENIAAYWPNSYTYTNFTLVENLQGTSQKNLRQSHYNKYESKFVFCEESAYESTTSSLYTAQSYGLTIDPLTKKYQIRNKGVAPLEIVSITIPDGFTCNEITTPLTIQGRERQAVDITLSETGQHKGNLIIVYREYGAETTAAKQFEFSGNKVAEGTWMEDFNAPTEDVNWPQGSVAESNVSGGSSTLSGGMYDNYIYCRWTSNPHFYTPLLHANAGDTFSFDLKKYSSASSGEFRVYVTKDRAEKGEPVMDIAFNALPSSYQTKTITIDEAGDYYIVFKLAGAQIDNLVGLSKVDVTHDLMIYDYTVSSEIRSGKEIKPEAKVYFLTEENAEDYTVSFMLNGESVATIESKTLPAAAKDYKSFECKYNPEVEETTTYESFIRFEFTDGTIIDTPKKDIKITYESYFAFGKSVSVTNDYYAPTSESAPINFGKINEPGQSVTYKIANWGGAPLVVNSITVPEGFSVTPTKCTVPGISTTDVVISFTATTPGTYSGNIEIDYVGAEENFTLPISGTMLDPNKWYVTFDGSYSTGGTWPAGSMAQKNVTLYEQGNYSNHNAVIQTTYSTSENMFISPLLRAEEGEELHFDAAAGSTGNPTVKVYAAKNRNDLLAKNEDGQYGEAILLGEFSAQAEDETHKLVKDVYNKYTVTIPEAGDYYIGFEPTNYGRVDEITGLSPVAVAGDMLLEGVSIPETAMQNVDKEGTIMVRNLQKPLEEGAYILRSFVDGELSIEVEGEIAIPSTNKLSDKINPIPVAFRSPKAGTFPVYFELAIGDYKVASEPVDVTFDEEIASAAIRIGEVAASPSKNTPLWLYDKNSESLSLFPEDYLLEQGLSHGDRITSLTVKGYGDGDYSTQLKAYYKWVDEAELGKPGDNSNYDHSDMTEIFTGTYNWLKGTSSASNYQDILTLTFPTPITFEEGKSLVLFFASYSSEWKTYFWEASTKTGTAYYHGNDGSEVGTLTGAWTECALPVIHLGLALEPNSLSGKVENADGDAVEGATVTLISNDGDNIQYTTQTDAEGNYSITVIQDTRTYDAEVKAGDKEDFVQGISVADASVEKDFTLIDVIQISDDGDHTDAPANAVIYLQKALNPGFNAVAFPMDLNKDEVEAIFGEDVVVLEFDGVTTDAAATVVNFKVVVSEEMEAGKPYLIFADQESKEVSFKTKASVVPLKTTSDAVTDFLATEKRTQVQDKMFVLDNYNYTFVAPNLTTRSVVELPAYSGYIKAPNATSLTFTTDANIETSVEDAMIEKVGEDVIYDLNGIRVKNPEKGIYIINGKAVRVK